MYELEQVGANTFYMSCPSKVGFFKTGENDVVCIDSGCDKDAGKKVLKILESQNWNLKAIFVTHSHADHIGGNAYLQSKTGCRIYANGAECAASLYPLNEPIYIYGGFPLKDLRTKFLLSDSSSVEMLNQDVLPPGLEIIELPGHCYDMVGFRTSDNVVFLADALASEETLDKYRIAFIYDVKAYLETLDIIDNMEASCFIASHAPQTTDIKPLVKKNIDSTNEIAQTICRILQQRMTYENLLAKLFEFYNLNMNLTQHYLVGSTVRSYLSYLKDSGFIDCSFENNLLYWYSK